MKNLFKKIIKLFVNLKKGIRRFPETGVLSILFVINGIILNRRPGFYRNSRDFFEHLMFALSLGIPLSTYGKLLYEKIKKKRLRIFTNIFFGILLILFYFAIPENLNQKFFTRFLILFLTEIVGLILIYTHDKKNPSLVILSLINKFAITFLFSAALHLGISASIFTVDNLFELSINNKIYIDLFISIVGLFSINYFLSIIPAISKKYDIKNYPVVFKKLFFYIGVPLILIYLAILYLYFVRILSLTVFPINMVSHLVMWYGFINTIVLFFIYRVKSQNKYISKFYKYFPYLMIVPLGMLFLAIGRRIYNFGFTPERYFVLILGIWITFSMGIIALVKKRKQILILISAFILLLISIYGPVNSFYISKLSQEKRFEYYLNKYDMIKNNKIIKNENLKKAQRREISQFISFFRRYYSFKDIDLLPEDFNQKKMNEVFGFNYVGRYSSYNVIRYTLYKNDYLIDISSYNYYLKTKINLDRTEKIEKNDFFFIYNKETKKIHVKGNGNNIIEIDMIKLIKDYDKRQNNSIINNFKEATIYYNNKNINLRIIIQEIYYRYDTGKGHLEAEIFFDLK